MTVIQSMVKMNGNLVVISSKRRAGCPHGVWK